MMRDQGPDIEFSAADRIKIAEIADCLIPGGAGLPSASDADAQGQWLDRVVAARRDLAAPLRKAARAEGDAPARLAALDQVELDSVRYAVAAAYLIVPQVRALLGYPAGVPARQPAYPDEAESYLEDGILDPVIARGPIYRPVPR